MVGCLVNWKGFGNKRLWRHLKYYFGLGREGQKGTMEASVRMADVVVRI
jgi:hypothetical protein